jgi:hypothetical protein
MDFWGMRKAIASSLRDRQGTGMIEGNPPVWSRSSITLNCREEEAGNKSYLRCHRLAVKI